MNILGVCVSFLLSLVLGNICNARSIYFAKIECYIHLRDVREEPRRADKEGAAGDRRVPGDG